MGKKHFIVNYDGYDDFYAYHSHGNVYVHDWTNDLILDQNYLYYITIDGYGDVYVFYGVYVLQNHHYYINDDDDGNLYLDFL